MHNNKSMSEQDILNDLLAMEKQISSAYNTGITEASCPNLRQTLTDSLVGTQQMQFTVYDSMRNQGWYQGKDAPDQDVNNAKNKYSNVKNQL